jgi:bifunctional DNA primase/polymerase-like protein/primase-like protein
MSDLLESKALLLSSALFYARELKIPVFPLRPKGKTPLTSHGFKDAVTEENQIRKWWKEYPDANIGGVTGSISNLCVVDIDPRHGGEKSFRLLELEHGDVPITPINLTGGGGLHIFFKHPGGIIKNRTGIMPGIDVRADGGYVVMPPSVHESGGSYKVKESAVLGLIETAPLPDWLHKLIINEKLLIPIGGNLRSMMNNAWCDVVLNGATEGQRNETTAKLAGHLFRRYVDPKVTLTLIQYWNRCANIPPLPDKEIIKIVDSIAGREFIRRNGRAS